MTVTYKKTGSTEQGYLEVGKYCAHCFFLLKKFPRRWVLAAGCKQDGWVIHGRYAYYPHGRVILDSIDIDETDSPQRLFELLTELAKKEGLKVCWA